MSQRQLTPLEAVSQERAVAVRILRMTFLVMIATITLLYSIERTQGVGATQSSLEAVAVWYMPVGFAVVATAVVLLLDLGTPRKRISLIAGLIFGLAAGLLATWALSAIVDLLASTYGLVKQTFDPVSKTNVTTQLPVVTAVKVMNGICMVYLATTTVLQTQDDFRLVIPYVEFAKQIRGPKPLLLDTSALIDARIVDVAQTGFVQVPIIIPRFVVAELQALGDSTDKMKRAKGKRGLETVARLQRMRAGGLDVSVDETAVPGKAVDQMLVELARIMPAGIVTGDAGLNRVAMIQGITVLNLNDLANALKPSLIAGSQLTISLVRPGEQPGQGVGYLDDGTMVVVEGGAGAIGAEANIEVTSTLQTSAGRLIFGKLHDGSLRVRVEDAEPEESDQTNAPQEHASLPGDPGAGGDSAEADEKGEGENEGESGPRAGGSESGTGAIAPPLTVRPPNPPPEKPGPLGPRRFGRGPRSPRR